MAARSLDWLGIVPKLPVALDHHQVVTAELQCQECVLRSPLQHLVPVIRCHFGLEDVKRSGWDRVKPLPTAEFTYPPHREDEFPPGRCRSVFPERGEFHTDVVVLDVSAIEKGVEDVAPRLCPRGIPVDSVSRKNGLAAPLLLNQRRGNLFEVAVAPSNISAVVPRTFPGR